MGFVHMVGFLSLLSIVCVSAQFTNINSVRVCIQSGNELQLKSQCVVCLRESYNFLMSLCCRVPYLPQNVTIEQGSCIVQACQQQKLDNTGTGITGFFSNIFNSFTGLFNRGRRDTGTSHLNGPLQSIRANWGKQHSNVASVVPQSDNVKNYFDTFYANAKGSSQSNSLFKRKK